MARLTAILLATLAAAPAAEHRLRVHAGPSIDIDSLTETPDGSLWLGGVGLWRFDGRRLTRVSDFADSKAVGVTVSGDGTLWVRADPVGLYRRRADHRHHRPFEKVFSGRVRSLEAGSDGIYLATPTNEKLHIGADGVARRAESLPLADGQGRPWRLCYFERLCWADNLPSWPHTRRNQAYRDRDGRVWGDGDDRAVAVRDGQVVARLEREHKVTALAELAPGRNGQVWFLGEPLRGVAPAITFAGESVAAIRAAFEDSRGHLWVSRGRTSLHEYIPEPGWGRWNATLHFSGDTPFQSLRNAQGDLVVAGRNRLYRQDGENWQPFGPTRERFEFVFATEDGGYLAALRESGLVRLDRTGRDVERIPDPTGQPKQYRAIARDDDGRVWVGHKAGFYELTGAPGSLRLREDALGQELEDRRDIHAVAFATDARGRLFAGYHKGIVKREGGAWRPLVTDRAYGSIRSLDVGADASTIWSAHRVVHSFFRLDRQGERWKVTEFAPGAGYAPPDSNFVHRDRRGWIWRSSEAGVHVADGVHLGPDDWILLSSANGSPAGAADIHGFFEDRDGSIWLAGDGGVTHVRPSPDWFVLNGQPPRVTWVEADSREAAPGEALDPAPKILKIQAATLHPPRFRETQWKYRLRPLFEEWRTSADGAFEFRDLQPRDYTLEIRLGGFNTSYPFRLGPPPAPIWPWVAGGLLAGLLVWRFKPMVDWILYHSAGWLSFLLPRGKPTELPPLAWSADSPYAGRLLHGRFQILSAVSRGSGAVVYAARDTHRDDAPVAVKMMPAHTERQQEFTRELTALQSLRDPGIVRILDWWIEETGERCLAMPFIEGPTLREAMEEAKIPPERLANVIERLGQALADVHRRGLVHRDFKPDNIMLENGQPVLIDFATAALRGPEGEAAVATVMTGTPLYMAPESLLLRYSPASDVFSFGVTVLELLTGRSQRELLDLRAESDLHRALAEALHSTVLATLIHEALDDDPRRRPADAERWATAVAQAIRDQEK